MAFELILTRLELGGKSNSRLVLVLDEFDQILLTLPSGVLRHLRAIKDRYPERLVYLVGTNRPLPTLGREDEEDIAEFYELFEVGGLIRLKGLNRAEADCLVNSYQADLAYSREELEWIYALGGGHPGLTQRLAQLLKDTKELRPEERLTLARLDPQLRLECRRIWNSLDPLNGLPCFSGWKVSAPFRLIRSWEVLKKEV